MYDIFGGAGDVGKSCADRGLECRIFDTSISAKLDVAKRHFLVGFRKACQAGQVAAAMFATPCASFSLAVSRGGQAIRTQSEPRGISGFLTVGERDRVNSGNRTLDATVNMLQVCCKFKIPAILENPRSSYLWWVPTLAKLILDNRAVIADVHQCAFKAHWRKETRFAFFNFTT